MHCTLNIMSLKSILRNGNCQVNNKPENQLQQGAFESTIFREDDAS